MMRAARSSPAYVSGPGRRPLVIFRCVKTRAISQRREGSKRSEAGLIRPVANGEGRRRLRRNALADKDLAVSASNLEQVVEPGNADYQIGTNAAIRDSVTVRR